VAYLVADEGSRLEVGNILARLAEKLPEHSIPAHIVVLERFPLLTSGKIDMAALPAPAAVHASETDDDEPATPGERMLADVWKGLLRLPTIRASDNFFDLGGDSLLALTMVMQVEKATRVRLNLLKLANSNLRALAAELPEEALAGDGRPASGLKRVLGLFGLGRKSPS
jgi:acyl carrier protein